MDWWDNLNRKPWLFYHQMQGFLAAFPINSLFSPRSSACFADPPVPVEWRLKYGTVSGCDGDHGSEAKIKHERSGSKLLSCRMSNSSGYWFLVEMLSYLIATSKLIESHSLQCPPGLALLLELPRGKGCHLPFFGPCDMSHESVQKKRVITQNKTS